MVNVKRNASVAARRAVRPGSAAPRGFPLLNVTDDGKLVESPIKVTLPSLIATLEALLIEALEPPQNRRRGDDFSVMEYIQNIEHRT